MKTTIWYYIASAKKKNHICVSFMMKRPMFNLIDSGFKKMWSSLEKWKEDIAVKRFRIT